MARHLPGGDNIRPKIAAAKDAGVVVTVGAITLSSDYGVHSGRRETDSKVGQRGLGPVYIVVSLSERSQCWERDGPLCWLKGVLWALCPLLSRRGNADGLHGMKE